MVKSDSMYINAVAAERGLQFLEEVPERLHMNIWIRRPEDVPMKMRPDCGTVCCYAGAVALTKDSTATNDMAEHVASLELAEGSVLTPAFIGNSLFTANGWDWPLKFWFAFEKAKEKNDHVEMVATLRSRVEHFAETGL